MDCIVGKKGDRYHGDVGEFARDDPSCSHGLATRPRKLKTRRRGDSLLDMTQPWVNPELKSISLTVGPITLNKRHLSPQQCNICSPRIYPVNIPYSQLLTDHRGLQIYYKNRPCFYCTRKLSRVFLGSKKSVFLASLCCQNGVDNFPSNNQCQGFLASLCAPCTGVSFQFFLCFKGTVQVMVLESTWFPLIFLLDYLPR